MNVLIIGDGLADMVIALQLLDTKLKIVLLDRDEEKNFEGHNTCVKSDIL